MISSAKLISKISNVYLLLQCFHSSFSMGFGKNPPVLSESTRKQVETQCVATMLAHVGFMSE